MSIFEYIALFILLAFCGYSLMILFKLLDTNWIKINLANTQTELDARSVLFEDSPKVVLKNLFLLPFRLMWDILVVALAVTLTVLWIGFVFGSVIGVVLLLIFMGVEGFLFPLGILQFCIPIWTKE